MVRLDEVVKFDREPADSRQVTGPWMLRAHIAGTIGGVVGALVLIIGFSHPVDAASKKPAPIDPFTMGSVQIVNALSFDGAVTISLDGRVRARGVPSMASTSPLAVPAGAHRVVVTPTLPNSSVPTAAVNGPQPRELFIDLSAGSRRTAFLTGTVLSPQLVVVDTAKGATRASKTVQVVDLRAPVQRTAIRVGGQIAKPGSGDSSAPIAVPAKATIEVVGNGAASEPIQAPSNGPLYVFIAQIGDRASVGRVRQNVVGLDSLRSPAPVIVRPHRSSFRFFASIALVVAATGATLSSMMVYRGRIRDERVRGLMAKSFSL